MDNTTDSRDFDELFSVIQSDSDGFDCADSVLSCSMRKIRSRRISTYIETTAPDLCHITENTQEPDDTANRPPFYDEIWDMGWLPFDELPNGTQYLLKLSGAAEDWNEIPYQIKLRIFQMIYDLPKLI